MTIEEAIAHAREVAENAECKECAEEHAQLAEWLEELKAIREDNHDFFIQYKNDAYNKGRAEAINEIHTELNTEIAMLNEEDMTDVNLYTFAVRIKDITDKLIDKRKGTENG